MRKLLPLTLVVCAAGCSYTVETGHRGLLFKRSGGLQKEAMNPGHYWIGPYDTVQDFDVTYSKHSEELHTNSSEALALDLRLAVAYRPIVEELYLLDTEIGANYYDEVIGPEFRSAVQGVFSRHSYKELRSKIREIEDECEEELRKRLDKKHIEISRVNIEEARYPVEIDNANRERLIAEQEAARNKTLLENQARQQELSLKNESERAKQKLAQDAEQAKMRFEQEKAKTEATVRAKQAERVLAEEQAKIDKMQAQAEAETQVIKARAQAEERKLLADALAKEKRAETQTVTPLTVMMHAYDALGKLGGDGTQILLGDWAHVPNFLFPNGPGGFVNPLHLPSGPTGPATSSRARHRSDETPTASVNE